MGDKEIPKRGSSLNHSARDLRARMRQPPQDQEPPPAPPPPFRLQPRNYNSPHRYVPERARQVPRLSHFGRPIGSAEPFRFYGSPEEEPAVVLPAHNDRPTDDLRTPRYRNSANNYVHAELPQNHHLSHGPRPAAPERQSYGLNAPINSHHGMGHMPPARPGQGFYSAEPYSPHGQTNLNYRATYESRNHQQQHNHSTPLRSMTNDPIVGSSSDDHQPDSQATPHARTTTPPRLGGLTPLADEEPFNLTADDVFQSSPFQFSPQHEPIEPQGHAERPESQSDPTPSGSRPDKHNISQTSIGDHKKSRRPSLSQPVVVPPRRSSTQFRPPQPPKTDEDPQPGSSTDPPITRQTHRGASLPFDWLNPPDVEVPFIHVQAPTPSDFNRRWSNDDVGDMIGNIERAETRKWELLSNYMTRRHGGRIHPTAMRHKYAEIIGVDPNNIFQVARWNAIRNNDDEHRELVEELQREHDEGRGDDTFSPRHDSSSSDA